jgi:hypothetical protein
MAASIFLSLPQSTLIPQPLLPEAVFQDHWWNRGKYAKGMKQVSFGHLHLYFSHIPVTPY